MLALAGADWEPVWVDFFNGGTRTPEYRELNEMGEVPVLEHGELAPHPVRRDPRLPRAALPRLRRRSPRRSAARSCAGRSGTTTSSPPTSRRLRFLMKFVPEEKTDQRVIAWLAQARRHAR